MREGVVDLGAVGAGAVDDDAAEHPLGIVEVGLRGDDFAQRNLGVVDARGVDENHGALVLQYDVVGVLIDELVDLRQGLVVTAILGRQLGQDEVVRIVGIDCGGLGAC